MAKGTEYVSSRVRDPTGMFPGQFQRGWARPFPELIVVVREKGCLIIQAHKLQAPPEGWGGSHSGVRPPLPREAGRRQGGRPEQQVLLEGSVTHSPASPGLWV